MRVLHLIEQQTCLRSPARAALLGDLLRHDKRCEHVVWFVGADATLADVLFPVNRVVYPWLGLGSLRPVQLWRWRRLAAQFDVVHCWSAKLAEAVKHAGWVPPMVDGTGLSLETVGVDAARLGDDRDALRRKFGVENRFLIAALADEPERADVLQGHRVLGLAGEAGYPVSLLAVPGAGRMASARLISDSIGKPEYVVGCDALRRPWEVLSACDAAVLLTSLDRSPLSVAWAATAGLPILVTGSEDAGSGPPTAARAAAAPLPEAIVHNRKIRDLAVALRRLIREPDVLTGSCQSMRQWAREQFDIHHWTAGQVAAYGRLAGVAA